MMIEQRAMALNQAFREANRERIMSILEQAEITQILKCEDESNYTPLFWACSSLP